MGSCVFVSSEVTPHKLSKPKVLPLIYIKMSLTGTSNKVNLVRNQAPTSTTIQFNIILPLTRGLESGFSPVLFR
jgi:hypothetical protein